MLGDSRATARSVRLVALLSAIVAIGCAIAFVLAPVRQPVVTYHWPQAGAAQHDAALPLMPYQPQRMRVEFTCAIVQRLAARGGDRVVLSTVPLHPDPSAPTVPGLRIDVDGQTLGVHSYGVTVASVPVPAGATCRFTLRSDPGGTSLRMGARPVATVRGDVRPMVAGLFTDAADTSGLHVRLVTDTRFQTTPTALKQALGWCCLAALLVMLGALWAADRRGGKALRRWRRRRWRPRASDVVVLLGLVAWMVIGPATVDDGWIDTMIRSAGSNGFVGNVYRWMNAPEAPFSWSYEVVRAWAALAPHGYASLLWLRAPATALGLVCWALLSRGVLPRLGRFVARPWTRAVAVVMFFGWWLPFTPGLRPEPWVAAGVLGVFVTTERALAARRVLPLAFALMIAAATVAETPPGLMATAPLLAAVVPVLRLLRSRTDLHRAPLILAMIAAPAGALLLMFTDQSLAAVRQAVHVRLLIGGGPPWYQEYERYVSLLSPRSFVGNLTLRGPVLLTLLALVALGWVLFGRSARRGPAGVAVAPARRLVGSVALGLAALTLVPTKWTYHFGGLAGLGAGVLVLVAYAWSRRGMRASAGEPDRGWRVREGWLRVAAIAGLTGVGSLVFAGWDLWPFVSDIGIPWGVARPHIGPVPLAELVLGVGSLLVAALTVGIAWRRAGGGDVPAVHRFVPAPGLLATAMIAVLVALNFTTFARAGIAFRGGYSIAGTDATSLTRPNCGLADDLLVETDAASGLLRPSGTGSGPSRLTGFAPISAGQSDDDPLRATGVALPGWQAVNATVGTASLRTGWYALPTAARSGALPVVVTVVGKLGAGNTVTAVFGRRAGGAVTATARVPVQDNAGSPGVRNARVAAPKGSDVVRLVAGHSGASAGSPFALSAPRVPRTTPMDALLPPGSAALLDWPVALVFPCIHPAPLRDGTAALPRWRIAPATGNTAAGITYDPVHGGPFVTPAMLVHEEKLPVYLWGSPTDELVDLYRWTPVTALARLRPTITSSTVSSWHREGRITVPGIDPAG